MRTLAAAASNCLQLGVLSVASAAPGDEIYARPADPEQQKYEEQVAREQANWLELSSNARQLFTDKSSEYIPLDQPSFVVDAIREVYAHSK